MPLEFALTQGANRPESDVSGPGGRRWSRVMAGHKHPQAASRCCHRVGVWADAEDRVPGHKTAREPAPRIEAGRLEDPLCRSRSSRSSRSSPRLPEWPCLADPFAGRTLGLAEGDAKSRTRCRMPGPDRASRSCRPVTRGRMALHRRFRKPRSFAECRVSPNRAQGSPRRPISAASAAGALRSPPRRDDARRAGCR